VSGTREPEPTNNNGGTDGEIGTENGAKQEAQRRREESEEDGRRPQAARSSKEIGDAQAQCRTKEGGTEEAPHGRAKGRPTKGRCPTTPSRSSARSGCSTDAR
jgi:hypothetical protein